MFRKEVVNGLFGYCCILRGKMEKGNTVVWLLFNGLNDKRVRKLIRSYLRCGVMIDGISVHSKEGTPQGGPLSPLLSNIVLDELGKELEKRGHQFVRYADDFMIYCKSLTAAERVKQSITKFLSVKLNLAVNKDKSAVSRPW